MDERAEGRPRVVGMSATRVCCVASLRAPPAFPRRANPLTPWLPPRTPSCWPGMICFTCPRMQETQISTSGRALNESITVRLWEALSCLADCLDARPAPLIGGIGQKERCMKRGLHCMSLALRSLGVTSELTITEWLQHSSVPEISTRQAWSHGHSPRR